MSLKLSLCVLMLGAAVVAHAETRVRTVGSIQYITYEEDGPTPGRVAIHDNSAIVIEYSSGNGVARPYERAANGQWQAGAPLFTVPASGDGSQDDVAIGIAQRAHRAGRKRRQRRSASRQQRQKVVARRQSRSMA